MKQVWVSDDGNCIGNKEDVSAYEDSSRLFSFVDDAIGRTMCDDAGFSIIETQDVVNFLTNNWESIKVEMAQLGFEDK